MCYAKQALTPGTGSNKNLCMLTNPPLPYSLILMTFGQASPLYVYIPWDQLPSSKVSFNQEKVLVPYSVIMKTDGSFVSFLSAH